jgi:hypothetical protein
MNAIYAWCLSLHTIVSGNYSYAGGNVEEGGPRTAIL